MGQPEPIADLILRPKPGPGPDCPDDLWVSFEARSLPYRLDPASGRLVRIHRFAPHSLGPVLRVGLEGLGEKLGVRRVALALVGMAGMVVAVMVGLAVSPSLARSAAVLAAARQVPVVRWVLPAPVRPTWRG